MKTRLCSAALVVGVLVLCGFSRDADATTVSIVSQNTTTLPTIAQIIYPTLIPTGSVQQVSGSVPNVYRSPFEDFSSHVIAPGYGNVQYTTIGSVGSGSAIINYSSPQTTLAILWGSPDTYNNLQFWSGANGGGSLIGSFTGSNLSILTYGHDLVSFLTNGGTFSSIVLSSSSAAFEFVIDPVSTPLPAALPLFATGLGLFGYFARRRKNRLAHAAMAAA